MAGYPAHENAAKMLENLRTALEKAGDGFKAKINTIIEKLDPIKDNRTFMRTLKAEKVTEESLDDTEKLVANPDDAGLVEKLEQDVDFLVEKVTTIVIKLT